MSDLTGTLVANKWRLEQRLGAGTFGEVWKVRHNVTGREKALKLLFENFSSTVEYVERFVREAQAASRTDSPHVVSIDDIGFDDSLRRSWLVMELLNGESLLDYIGHEPNRVSPGEAVVILRQIASALDAAHRAGIVHRDLKPENVVLCWPADGSVLVKVLDFGIAKLLDARTSVLPSAPGANGASLSGTVGFIGTPGYAAPEQVADARSVTPAADIFALGIVSFELLTGSVYWRGEDAVELFAEALAGATELPSTRAPAIAPLSAAYDAWFAQACASDPLVRFATAGEAVRALQTALGVVDPIPSPRRRGLAASAAEVIERHSDRAKPRLLLVDGAQSHGGSLAVGNAATLPEGVAVVASRSGQHPLLHSRPDQRGSLVRGSHLATACAAAAAVIAFAVASGTTPHRASFTASAAARAAHVLATTASLPRAQPLPESRLTQTPPTPVVVAATAALPANRRATPIARATPLRGPAVSASAARSAAAASPAARFVTARYEPVGL